MSYFPTFSLILLLIWSCLPATAQSVWTPQSSGTENGLTGVVYGGGQFVAVGDPGGILTSPDGVTWTARTSGTDKSLRGITYGNGLFLATGAGGAALTSPDGATWTPQNARTGTLLSGAAFGNGTFVAVGGSGTARYSADGVTWSLGVVPTTAALQGVCFGGGKFVAVGSGGAIVHSTDGQLWSSATSGPLSFDYFFAASYMNGTYVVTGQGGAILTSSDAASWIRQPVVEFTRLRSVTNNGLQFVAVGDPLPDEPVPVPGKVLTSTDGITWTSADLRVGVELNGICYGPGTYVIVGEPAGSPSNALVFTSEDDLMTELTFEAWRQVEFTAAELADPLVSGAGADPDCDGNPNFTEYALGLLPKDPGERRALPQVAKSAAGDLTVTFMRPADRVGIVIYSACSSTDLANWTPLNQPEEIVSEIDGIQTVRFTDPDPAGPRRFYKLGFAES